MHFVVTIYSFLFLALLCFTLCAFKTGMIKIPVQCWKPTNKSHLRPLLPSVIKNKACLISRCRKDLLPQHHAAMKKHFEKRIKLESIKQFEPVIQNEPKNSNPIKTTILSNLRGTLPFCTIYCETFCWVLF